MSHAERMLSAIEALLENRATQDVQSYVIAGRRLDKMPIADLLHFRAVYKAEVEAAGREARAALGLKTDNTITVVFD